MFFRPLAGETMVSLHGPNAAGNDDYEHLLLYPVAEKNGLIEIA